MRSIRYSNRAGTTKGERGYALLAALVLAILYFGLMELMLIDSTRSLNEAQHFRAKILSATLAEDAAELSAESLVTSYKRHIPPIEDNQGIRTGTMTRSQSSMAGTKEDFEIKASGSAAGVSESSATVYIKGAVDGTSISIEETRHSQ